MNEELEKRLFDAFPQLFRPHGNPPVRLDGYGISTGDGWYKLIYELCMQIQKHADEAGLNPLALQVKAKFGGLRFYMHGANDAIADAVTKAEQLSFEVCEVCGALGTRRYHDWIQTLCDAHNEEYIAEHGDDCDDGYDYGDEVES